MSVPSEEYRRKAEDAGRQSQDVPRATCEKCQARVWRVAGVIYPRSNKPGYRIFHCEACQHDTWTEWLYEARPAKPQGE